MQDKSFAMELLDDMKKTNKRMFIIWIITFVGLLLAVGYIIHLSNKYQRIEDTIEIEDVEESDNSHIKIGDEYGRRGRDMKYRGDDELDRLSGEYGRYMENRSRYGASEETDKSFYHMTEAYKDFGKVLMEEAETQEQKNMLRQAVQQTMQMM